MPVPLPLSILHDLASSDTRRTCLRRVSDLVSEHAVYAERPQVPAVARANAMVASPQLDRPCKVRALYYVYRCWRQLPN